MIRGGAFLFAFFYPLAALAAPSNLEQARRGLAELVERREAYRIELHWQEAASPQPHDQLPEALRGVFDGERYRYQVERKGIPGETGLLAAKSLIFCYDGEKSSCYLDHEDAQDAFYIDKRSNIRLPELYRPFFASEFLARENLKALEPTEICGANCVGFEETINSTQYGLRQVRRLWLDPENGWLPLRTEQLVYSLDEDPPDLSDAAICTATRVGLNDAGVPFVAEAAVEWKYANEISERTVVCRNFETGIAVTDDMFTMEPPPGTEVVDEVAGAEYTAGEAGAVDDVLEEGEPVDETGSAAPAPTAKEAASKSIDKTSEPRSTIFPSGWALVFGLSFGLAFAAGFWLMMRYLRRIRPD